MAKPNPFPPHRTEADLRLRDLTSDAAVLAAIGSRMARERIALELTQHDLAMKAGVSVGSIHRFEHGDSVQFSTVVRILRALDLVDSLDRALPRALESPIEALHRVEHGAPRRRVRRKGSPAVVRDALPWKTGDGSSSR